jgi:hypothetical protein
VAWWLAGLGDLGGFLLFGLGAFDVIAPGSSFIRNTMNAPTVRPMAIHTQPGIGCLAAGWWRLAPRLGAGFSLAANLHTLQGFQAQQFQALLEGASGQGGEAQAALLCSGVSAVRIGQFS